MQGSNLRQAFGAAGLVGGLEIFAGLQSWELWELECIGLLEGAFLLLADCWHSLQCLGTFVAGLSFVQDSEVGQAFAVVVPELVLHLGQLLDQSAVD